MRQCAMDRGQILHCEEALDHLFYYEELGEPIFAEDSPFRSRQLLQRGSLALSDQRNLASYSFCLPTEMNSAPLS